MFNWKYGVLLLVACAVTVGCADKVEPLPTPVIEVQKPPVPWPTPVRPVSLSSFKFDVIQNKLWAMLSYQDYIKLSEGQVDKERFVRDLMAMVCYYQPDKERCSFLNDNK